MLAFFSVAPLDGFTVLQIFTAAIYCHLKWRKNKVTVRVLPFCSSTLFAYSVHYRYFDAVKHCVAATAVSCNQNQRHLDPVVTKIRKLSYRKDDRAMRPIYGCPKHFRVPKYARGYFSRTFNGVLFQSILYMNVRKISRSS